MKRFLRAASSLAPLAAIAGGSIAGQVQAAQPVRAVRVFRGPVEGMRYGPVRAIIAVRSRRIVGVTIDVSSDLVRSKFINGYALPLLRAETLQAQSASINMVSGATQTSEAYIESLYFAIHRAEKQGALKD